MFSGIFEPTHFIFEIRRAIDDFAEKMNFEPNQDPVRTWQIHVHPNHIPNVDPDEIELQFQGMKLVIDYRVPRRVVQIRATEDWA